MRHLRPLAAWIIWAVAAGCSHGATGPEPPAAPSSPPQRLTFEVRDMLADGSLPVGDAALILDGAEIRPVEGMAAVELAPGRHELSVSHPDYREDLFALRFAEEALPRGQAVGERVLSFDVRPGDERAELLVVSRSLDVPLLLSFLDEGVSYRWPGRVNLHVDLSPTRFGFVLPAERVGEIAAFVKAALEEISAGALTLGDVSTGTGLEWKDFLLSERPGTITLQFGELVVPINGVEVGGWGLYREEQGETGMIRSGNVIVDAETFRTPARDFRPGLGHEIGHALSLQHPLPCRRWSRMDPGRNVCESTLPVTLADGAFWSPTDRFAGKLVYAFQPGTDFSRLTAVASAD